MNDGTSHVSVPSWARMAIFCAMLSMDFTGFACYSVMGPFFPTEALRKGVTQTVTGLIFSSYALTVLLSSSVWGHFISKSSPRLYVVWGGVISGLATIVFGFLSIIEDATVFTVACFVVRIIEALGFAAINIGIFATMGRLYPNSLGSSMAFVEMTIGVGLGAGPAVGSSLYSVGGYPAPFVALGIALLVSSAIVYILIAAIPFVQTEIFGKVTSETSLTLGKLLRTPATLVTLLAVFSSGCSFTVLLPILAVRVQEIGIDEATSGYLFSTELGVYAVTVILVGKVVDRYRRHRFQMIISGLFIQGLGLILVGPSPIFKILDLPIVNSLSSNIIGLILLGAGGAFVNVPSYGALIDGASDAGYDEGIATHGIVGGAWNSFFQLGDMAGPAAAAALTEQINYEMATTVFALGAFGFAGVTLLYVAWGESSRRGQTEETKERDEVTFYGAMDPSNGKNANSERTPLLHGYNAATTAVY